MLLSSFIAATAADRPNILWITAEDMSANLGCYGDTYANTPHLDAFERESVRYTHAFATAPVCSPARSTLITGCYASSLGTQRLRSAFPIPDSIKGFPEYLRDAGYFTSNNVKTDYNIANENSFIEKTWNRNAADAHWRDRKNADTPFFSVFNLMTTHQSRANVWPWEQFEKEVGSRLSQSKRHDPNAAPVPPYYPDTPLIRRTLARYYDCVTAMDKEVGTLLSQLEADGMDDNTIVFFYSDHGMGMPRGKRLLHDSGMHVPLMIRFPKKWQHLAPAAPGQSTDRLVSFVDFAPTLLSLLGLDIPQHMQGSAFLGEKKREPRKFVFGARDRVDEVFDLSRSIRDKRWLLIRNHMPHLSWMPPERYSDNADMRRELKQLASEGKLNAAQMTYASAQRAPLEFYDTETDPYQIRNLAQNSVHAERIETMEKELDQWCASTSDLGMQMEPEFLDKLNGRAPWEFARNENVEIPADFWKIVRLRSSDPAPADLVQYLQHPSVSVRIEAAAALAGIGDPTASLEVLSKELQNPRVEARLHAMRSLELMGKKARSLAPRIEAARDEAIRRAAEHPCWMFVQFSAEAALEGLD